MLTRIAAFVVALLCGATLSADEPKSLVELRERFHALKRPTETERVRYVTALVRLGETFTRADYKKIEAIGAEIIKHPMPPNVDSADLRKRIVGQWTSPRHNYLYRADGTWTMLPEFEHGYQATHGMWHIQGNKFFQSALVQPPEPTDKGETMIILTDTDFVWGTHISPYCMRKGDVYPWRN
jgi:hypothetical protein